MRCPLQSIAGKLENAGTKMFLQIYQILSNFDSNRLICDSTLFPGKNSPNIAKSNRVFPGEWRGDRTLILTYLNSPMAKVFSHYCLSFLLLAIFRRKSVVKVGPKVQTLDPSLFYENSDLSNFFQTMFLLARVLLLVRILAILDHIWSSKGTKTSQKGPFHGC